MFGFDTVVYLVLRTVLGRFIDLSSTTLSLNFLAGSFEFRDLYLSPDLLVRLGLPVTLFRGRVGLLRLKVPWRKLWEKSVEIEIDGITVVGSSKELEKEVGDRCFCRCSSFV